MANEQLAKAVQDWEAETGKHRSELVRGITTTRSLDRWIEGAKADPFKSRQLARRLKRHYGTVFGG